MTIIPESGYVDFKLDTLMSVEEIQYLVAAFEIAGVPQKAVIDDIQWRYTGPSGYNLSVRWRMSK